MEAILINNATSNLAQDQKYNDLRLDISSRSDPSIKVYLSDNWRHFGVTSWLWGNVDVIPAWSPHILGCLAVLCWLTLSLSAQLSAGDRKLGACLAAVTSCRKLSTAATFCLLPPATSKVRRIYRLKGTCNKVQYGMYWWHCSRYFLFSDVWMLMLWQGMEAWREEVILTHQSSPGTRTTSRGGH